MERILLPTPDYPPKRGGVARYLFALAQSFPSIHVLVWKELPGYKLMMLDFWWRRKAFDVILTSHILPIGTTAMMFRLLTGKKYDVILHGQDFDLARTSMKRSVLTFFVLWFARRVFANSKALSSEVASYSHRSVLTMYPCVSSALIEAAAMVAIKSDRSDAKIRLLTVARLVERKGHLKVIEAIESMPNVTYTIVGDGPMRKPIIDEVARRGMKDRVIVMQHVSDGKLPELYSSHDIFVMPTSKSKTDREGFGIVYLEAGLFGLPVIATRQPGVDEAVVDGETGILINDSIDDLKTAIEKLGADEMLRQKMGTMSHDRVFKNFIANKTFAVFGSATSYHPSPINTPLVSIIIPTFQHAKSITSCIESVLKQTYNKIEIIIVDDGSTDNTQAVLEVFKGKISVIRQPNKGGNAARNRGAETAKGEYIIFVDADAELKPGMIEIFLQALQSNPSASYSYSAFRFGWKRFRGIEFSAERLRRVNFITTSALIRREHFPGFDEKLRRFQDWDLWLTMLEQNHIGILVKGTWFKLNIDGDSRTGSSWLPAITYRLPWKLIGWKPLRVKKYEEARQIIAKKHSL